MYLSGKWRASVFCITATGCLLFSAPASLQEKIQDISDPLSVIFREIRSGMSHVEVNAILIKYSPEKHDWGIHERDLRERNDLWSVYRWYAIENIFSESGEIIIDLHIYFIGSKVGCVFYRYWGEEVQERKQKGRFCQIFTGD